MWADPARESDLNEQNQNLLFLENERRKTSCLFTENALKEFMKNTGYHYVIRAHECHVSTEKGVSKWNQPILGAFDFSQNLSKTPLGDFNQISEEY